PAPLHVCRLSRRSHPCPAPVDSLSLHDALPISVVAAGADCLRINPGNIGSDAKVREVVACAKDYNIPIRIGVNAGSLEKDIQRKYTEPTGEAMLESAMRHIDILERLNFDQYKVSVKASNVFLTLDAYRLISAQI